MASITELGRGAVVASVVLAAALLACDEPAKGTKSSPSGTAVSTTSPTEDAKSIAQNRCAMCHGEGGRGDGPQARTLTPKPRDLSSKEWQRSVSDAQIRTAILQGGSGVGKSVLMPSNPDLADKPAVLDALVKIVRGYAQ